jgi:phosphoglycerate dehydrogenase-like enzyme
MEFRTKKDAVPRIHVAVGPTLFARLFTPEARDALCALGKVTFQTSDKSSDENGKSRSLQTCRVLVAGWTTPRLTSEILASSPALQLVAHTGASVRGLVDKTFFGTGVRIVNAGHVMVNPVAEFTIMQILRALRGKVDVRDIADTAPDAWSVWKRTPGAELAGCTVGVIGAGQIGRRVIHLLRAFDARVLVYDPCVTKKEAKAMGVVSVGLHDLLRASRIVTLHTPVLDSTRGMLGPTELALMQNGAWLINTARSPLMNTAALVRELRSGRISAALDVFDTEPLPADSPLRKLPNVSLTPHTAFMTSECLRGLGDSTVDEIRRFLAGKPLRREVTARMYKTMA